MQVETKDFGWAIAQMKQGKKVARQGWNGKGMFIYLVNGSKVPSRTLRTETKNAMYGDRTPEADDLTIINPHIDMRAADGTLVIGWLASQTDMLAEDYYIVE